MWQKTPEFKDWEVEASPCNLFFYKLLWNYIIWIQEDFQVYRFVFDLTGVISKRDFHKAMESHKHYTQSETEYLLSCAETDENELLDYEEFVERFHEPAKVSDQKTQTDYIFESSHQDFYWIFCLFFLFVFPYFGVEDI